VPGRYCSSRKVLWKDQHPSWALSSTCCLRPHTRHYARHRPQQLSSICSTPPAIHWRFVFEVPDSPLTHPYFNSVKWLSLQPVSFHRSYHHSTHYSQEANLMLLRRARHIRRTPLNTRMIKHMPRVKSPPSSAASAPCATCHCSISLYYQSRSWRPACWLCRPSPCSLEEGWRARLRRPSRGRSTGMA
jgi:hypothetical protein